MSGAGPSGVPVPTDPADDCWRQVAELEAELAETNQGVVALSLELEGYRAHLEDLVAERTEQLESARRELERANARLRDATERATAANRAKSAFLANMSHELRTPLNAIIGFTSLLREPSTAEQHAEYLDIVDRSGTHLLALINDVLDLAKIESGRMEPDWGSGDPTRLAGDVVALLRDRADGQGLDLSLRVASDVPAAIRCDEVKVRQILLNLVGNAIRCTPSGSVVVDVTVAATESGPSVVWSVVDTGIGIGAEDLAAVFEPFHQAGARAGGTGLGLPISRTYAELMGGSLTVRSRPGVGSDFRLQLPLVPAPSAPATVAPATENRIPYAIEGDRSVRVLVAEDDPVNVLLMRTILERIGVACTVVGDGEQAVATCRRERPDLVFLDRRMPVMDGLTAALRIREDGGADRPVIVAVTASALAEDHADMRRAGIDEVVTKPFRPGQIVACLRDLLGVRFRYRDDAPPPEAEVPLRLDDTALARVSEPLRTELAAAVEGLDPQRIDAAITAVAREDDSVAATIRSLTAAWRHQDVLDALDRLGPPSA